MKELIDYPYITFGVSDGGAHTKFLTAGRYPTEGIDRVSCARANGSRSRTSTGASRAAGVLRGLQGSRLPARGRAGRYRGLRFRQAERAAGRDRARPAGQRMASRAACRRLSAISSSTAQITFGKAKVHGRDSGQGCCATAQRHSGARESGDRNTGNGRRREWRRRPLPFGPRRRCAGDFKCYLKSFLSSPRAGGRSRHYRGRANIALLRSR